MRGDLSFVHLRMPIDASRTEIDVLVLQNQILFQSEQPKLGKDETWMQEFELD